MLIFHLLTEPSSASRRCVNCTNVLSSIDHILGKTYGPLIILFVNVLQLASHDMGQDVGISDIILIIMGIFQVKCILPVKILLDCSKISE